MYRSRPVTKDQRLMIEKDKAINAIEKRHVKVSLARVYAVMQGAFIQGKDRILSPLVHT